jgi:ATP-dependent RNA helicase DDX27
VCHIPPASNLQVNDLARLSLHNPQKIAVDPMYSLADHLVQEFIRIRPSRESDREAIVLALCARSFTSRVIVFFRNKAHCHRMAILFGLNQLNAAELHGNLTQTQRLGTPNPDPVTDLSTL